MLAHTGEMPELPEVTALVADLRERAVGRVVDRLDIRAFAALKTAGIASTALNGLTVDAVDRHGKFLDLRIGPHHLVIHLARAGWMKWRDEVPDTVARSGKGPLAARLVFADTDTGDACLDITEAGTKKSLALYLVDDPGEVPGVARLGPDPLDPSFTFDVFARILADAGRSQIKGVLRNQSLIAGIGNAYSDEILHVARMSPFAPAAMTGDDAERLYAALESTLADAIARAAGVPAAGLKGEKRSGMRVHGRTGEQCPVCGDTVREVTYSDSSLQYCPTCQTKGKPLADRVLSRLLK